MNRPIKFRVYSFLDKAFHHFTLEEGYPQGIAGGVSEPQQYTGLNDSKGNEIFEWDIVKWGDLNYIVEYNHTACKWQGRSPEHHGYLHLVTEHFRDLMNGIIISNIFEYSKLLN